MMTGNVSGRHALVPVTLRIFGQPDLSIEFVLDTGFAGFLSLPPAAVARLALPFRYRVPAGLADGSQIMVSVHVATILWHGAEHRTEVIATGRQPLLGTSLLDGNDLSIRFDDGGPVTIQQF
jgi:clan AA aspartic protease